MPLRLTRGQALHRRERQDRTDSPKRIEHHRNTIAEMSSHGREVSIQMATGSAMTGLKPMADEFRKIEVPSSNRRSSSGRSEKVEVKHNDKKGSCITWPSNATTRFY
jgi:hypothetical protein